MQSDSMQNSLVARSQPVFTSAHADDSEFRYSKSIIDSLSSRNQFSGTYDQTVLSDDCRPQTLQSALTRPAWNYLAAGTIISVIGLLAAEFTILSPSRII